jgi:hypothetical protein
MNRFIVVLGCMSILVLSSFLASAQYSYSGEGLYTQIPSDSMLFHLGSIQLNGFFYGIEADEFIDSFQEFSQDQFISQYIPSTLLQNLHFIPIFGFTSFNDISNITIIPQDIIESLEISNSEQLIDEMDFYSDASISISNGLFLVGTSGESIDYHFQHPSCLSGIISLPFEGIDELQSFVTLTDKNSTASLAYQDNYLMIYPFSEDCHIKIYTKQDELIWNNQQTPSIFLLKNDSYTFNELSTLHVVPISNTNKESTFNSNLIPAKKPPNIINILKHTDILGEEFNIQSFPFLSDSNQGANLIRSLSSMLNGGIIFVNHSGQVEIDQTLHSFQQFGFTRIDDASISINDTNVIVEADYSLVFLGDHFYSSQAATSQHGIAIPLFPIILWIVAIGSIIAFYLLKIKKNIIISITEKWLQYFMIIVHLLGYIIAFILLDFTVSHQFGISLFTEISLNGFSVIAGIFLIIQIILWFIGFFFAAVPLGIISSKVFNYIGFDKSYQHGINAIMALTIWPVVTLYLTMFLNVILLIFNPFNAMI